MRAPERYLLSITVTYAVTSFVLAVYSSTGLDLYVSVFIVEYFILTLLNPIFTPKTQKITNLIGYTLFGVFLVIVTMKVIEILGANLL